MKKLLILSANPKNTEYLRLGEEVREIEAALKQARERDQFEIITQSALRIDDLRRTLLNHKPQIVHFSGHGAGDNGLVLENSSGLMQLVSTKSLAELFGLFRKVIKCVVLNACYSEVQAEAIFQHINCVVGMNQAIGDRAAIKFATGFYDALGAGESYDQAYKFGCNAIDMEGIPESSTPMIKFRPSDDTLPNSVPIPDKEAVLEALKILLPAQFDTVVFRYGVEPEYITVDAPQAQKAIKVIQYAEQKEDASLTQLIEVIYKVAPHLRRLFNG